jgi:hypothetical protein
MNMEEVSKIAHEVNRAYCQRTKDYRLFNRNVRDDSMKRFFWNYRMLRRGYGMNSFRALRESWRLQ